MNKKSRIEEYNKTIGQIPKGQRNATVYKYGLTCRTEFGLVGDELESALSELNQAKCTPPLSSDEVAEIVKSVDKSDKPIGESTLDRIGEGFQKSQTSKQQTGYYVSARSKSLSVATLLAKRISVYKDCHATVPKATMTIGKVLEAYKSGGKSRDLIEAIRNEPDKNKRNDLKKRLTGVVFGSEPQKKRTAKDCTANRVLGVDLDNIPTDELESAKEKIAAVPYVFAVGLSASGTGIFALVAYAGTTDIKALLAAMQADFDYEIDKSCSDISRLRFTTLDENLIVNDEVFPAILNKRIIAEPEAIITSKEPLAWEPFPIDTFPKTLANYATESSASINVDSAYVGPSCLAAVASVIGSGIRIELKTGWREPSIIWTATVADSGSGKSPGLKAAIDPLYELQTKADKRYQNAAEEFETAIAIFRKDFSKWVNNRKKNLLLVKPENPIEPTIVAYIADDTTPEALIEVLAENPFGVCLPKDELSGWLGGFDAYRSGGGSKDLSFWLQSHGGQPVRVNRKSGKKLATADTPSVSICGGIQPGMLRKILKTNEHFFDAGLAARILYAMPPDLPQRWTDAVVSDVTKNQYWNIFKTILSWRNGLDALNPAKPLILTLSEAAKSQFIGFYDANADERAAMESSTQKAFWPKLTGYAARIALVFHVVKWIEGSTADQHVVDGETMESAIRLTQWFKRESLRIVEAMRGEAPQIDTDASLALRAIRSREGKITVRELAGNGPRIFRGDSGRAERVLREMVVDGTLTVNSEPSKRGPAKEVFRLTE